MRTISFELDDKHFIATHYHPQKLNRFENLRRRKFRFQMRKKHEHIKKKSIFLNAINIANNPQTKHSFWTKNRQQSSWNEEIKSTKEKKTSRISQNMWKIHVELSHLSFKSLSKNGIWKTAIYKGKNHVHLEAKFLCLQIYLFSTDMMYVRIPFWLHIGTKTEYSNRIHTSCNIFFQSFVKFMFLDPIYMLFIVFPVFRLYHFIASQTISIRQYIMSTKIGIW